MKNARQKFINYQDIQKYHIIAPIKLSSSFYTKTFIPQIDVPTYNPINDENIIFNLSFDGISDNTIIDISGNGNHGAIYGAQWVENNQLGDMNEDNEVNVIDIVALVNTILNP